MKEGLAGHHGASDTVLSERLLDLIDDFRLAIRHQVFSRDYVGIMSGPVGDSDLRQMTDHLARRDWLARGGMEERLALVGRRPLRSADEILPASFGRIASSAGGHQALHKSALVLGRYGLCHECPPLGNWSRVPGPIRYSLMQPRPKTLSVLSRQLSVKAEIRNQNKPGTVSSALISDCCLVFY